MQLELEQRTPDFPKMWHITEYTFEVDDLQLQQGENRNYRLQASDDSSSNINNNSCGYSIAYYYYWFLSTMTMGK